MNGHEGTHTGLVYLAGEAVAINQLEDQGIQVKDLVKTGGMSVTVIQTEIDGVDKPSPDYGMKVAQAYAAIDRMSPYIITVGPDIDPYDRIDVLWAVGLRAWPVTDSALTKEGLIHTTAPRIATGGGTGNLSFLQGMAHSEQMIIDALIKYPERYAEWPPRSDPYEWELGAVEGMRNKLGH